MSVWDVAGAAITATFVDPEPIIYTHKGETVGAIRAIRSDCRGCTAPHAIS